MSTDPTDTDIAGLVERLGYHHEHPVTGQLVLRNPDGPKAADALERLQAERDGLVRAFDEASHSQDQWRARALNADAERDGQWQDIATAPKNKKVLVAYRNALGNWRIVTACYHTQLPWSDEEAGLHEAEYAPEGWYEESDSSETIYRTSSPPTHWRHLPPPPSTGVQHD